MCEGATCMLKQHAFHLHVSPPPPLPILLLLICLWLASICCDLFCHP